MDYSKPSFTVPVGSDAFRKGYEGIDWGKKPATDSTSAGEVTTEKTQENDSNHVE